jgi:hypothetical protein
METMVDLVCSVCGKHFQRRLTEYKRCRRKNFKVVCDKVCWAKSPKKPSLGNPQNLKMGRERDEFSPFRKFLNNARSRDADCDLTLEFLKMKWETQQGICPYTRIQMILHPISASKTLRSPNRASLDRIDSNRGYRQDNIEFVCLFINLGKNGFTKQSILDIVNFNKSP